MSDGTTRHEFESWISAPPYEQSIERHPIDSKRTNWPGQYRHYATQLAWEAWEARQARDGQIAAERAAVVKFICDHREWTTLRLIIAIGNGDHRRELDAAVRGIGRGCAGRTGRRPLCRSLPTDARGVREALEQEESPGGDR